VINRPPATTFRLADVCPRLALARDQHNAAVRQRQMHELNRIIDRHELERLVAHRELQLLRAFHTRRGRYIAERQRKLAWAVAALARFDAQDQQGQQAA
jgi:hypothetical protein